MNIADQLRTYRNGVHGAFFLEAADRLEELESENENLHIENDNLKYSGAVRSGVLVEMRCCNGGQ